MSIEKVPKGKGVDRIRESEEEKKEPGKSGKNAKDLKKKEYSPPRKK